MKRKMFIFDLDGTAGDTLASIHHTAEMAFSDYGIEVPALERFCYFAGDGADVMLRRALAESGVSDPDTTQKVIRRYRKYFPEGCTYRVKSFPGLPEALRELKSRGLLLTVCSNKDDRMARKVIRTIYGEGFFDEVIGMSEKYPGKPDPAMPLALCSGLRVRPEECVYVGDTNTDMKCGKAAGMFTVGVLWGFRTKEELLDAGADLLIDDPAQLPRLIGPDL